MEVVCEETKTIDKKTPTGKNKLQINKSEWLYKNKELVFESIGRSSHCVIKRSVKAFDAFY